MLSGSLTKKKNISSLVDLVTAAMMTGFGSAYLNEYMNVP